MRLRDLLQEWIFTVGVTGISRAFLFRDRLSGRMRQIRSVRHAGSAETKHTIQSKLGPVDAVFVRPSMAEVAAGLLICHGIGETVEHWRPVQHLLALQGVASLVFDYTGYGQSRGRVTARGCEANALAALETLRGLVPGRPVHLLGFSLGTGVVCAVGERARFESLVLCAGFTSFRQAARRFAAPGWMVPAVWDNEERLRRCEVPVLILHGEQDALFPVAMAERLRDACGSGRLVTWPGFGHDDAYFRPRVRYWETVAQAVKG